uniref:FAB heavy chain n=1 Tax=Mus musculus TaxID=10090 RepID=UPI002493CFF2|nr:Chain C, FAB heavy chain [Mus musculus]8D2T_C Chain C, FAB heavy chain [Mus musculus]8D2U_C Chain C, FAB heavy chain [Mus musculus]8D2V_C Chain C, FAB heavy chain [Mus musculus]8D2W_C Chain C, FAB heavy chain [Mus musculus]8D2X_C Chain C, FAB heavy chain [Mus musculus]
ASKLELSGPAEPRGSKSAQITCKAKGFPEARFWVFWLFQRAAALDWPAANFSGGPVQFESRFQGNASLKGSQAQANAELNIGALGSSTATYRCGWKLANGGFFPSWGGANVNGAAGAKAPAVYPVEISGAGTGSVTLGCLVKGYNAKPNLTWPGASGALTFPSELNGALWNLASAVTGSGFPSATCAVGFGAATDVDKKVAAA